ncbi:MAG TPA: glycosyltransferase family 39 protein [Longimicrobiaceae bacterium]|nr:glycosyltransferase family 39 protein [Longimicrobiaceae bacterium]
MTPFPTLVSDRNTPPGHQPHAPSDRDRLPGRSRVPGDLLLPVAASLSLIASCIVISGKKPLWLDEVFTYLLLNDPSLSHMLQALADQVDATPPLYYTVGWLWARVFGGAELSIRLLSSAAFCVAVFLSWALLRRAYGVLAAAVGLLTVFGTSDLLLTQNAEARVYGVLTALFAGCCLMYQKTAEEESPSGKWLLLSAVLHGALLLTHVYGAFYGAALIGAAVLDDLRRRRFRPRVYAAIPAGWLAIAVWLPGMLNQIDVARPRSWMTTPGLKDLVRAYNFNIPPLLLLGLVLLGGGMLLARRVPPASVLGARREPERTALLVLALALLTIPAVSFAYSRIATPIFNERYFLPCSLVWAIALAEMVTLASGPSRGTRGLPVAGIGWAALCAGLLLWPLGYAVRYRAHQPTTRAEVARLGVPGDLPVLSESSHDFLPGSVYSARTGLDTYFVLDWPAALAGARDATIEFKYMSAIRRNYGLRGIVSAAEFLCAHRRFVVLDDRVAQWYDLRIRDRPQFSTRVLGEAGEETVVLVERPGDLPQGTCGGDG